MITWLILQGLCKRLLVSSKLALLPHTCYYPLDEFYKVYPIFQPQNSLMFHFIVDKSTPQHLKTLGTNILIQKSDIQNIQHLQSGVFIISLLLRLMAAFYGVQCYTDRFKVFSFKSYLAVNNQRLVSVMYRNVPVSIRFIWY